MNQSPSSQPPGGKKKGRNRKRNKNKKKQQQQPDSKNEDVIADASVTAVSEEANTKGETTVAPDLNQATVGDVQNEDVAGASAKAEAPQPEAAATEAPENVAAQAQNLNEPTPTTPTKKPAESMEVSATQASNHATTTDSATKKIAKSPLIVERHNWLQEQETIRKRQSISEADLQKLKEQNTALQLQSPSPSHQLQDVPQEVPKSTEDIDQFDLASKFSGVSPLSSPQRPTKSNHGAAGASATLSPPKNRVKADSIDVHTAVLGNDDTTAGAKMLANDELVWLSDGGGSMVSIDSLDMVDREYLGDARKQHANDQPISDSDLTQTHKNSSNHPSTTEGALATLQVADSTFLGFAQTGISNSSELLEFVSSIKRNHPTAAHIPYAFSLPLSKNKESENNDGNNNDGSSSTFDAANGIGSSIDGKAAGFDEDGEPENSAGPFLLEKVQASRHEKDGVWLFPEEAGGALAPENSGIVVVIVRYFGSNLLGVTCGRLSQCYERISQLTLHRLFRGCRVPLIIDFSGAKQQQQSNIYGLAAGDTELHLNVVEGDQNLMSTLLDELDFGGFKGAKGEVLPRLQNLQADFYQYDSVSNEAVPCETGTVYPIYRYPGNYTGDEWETFHWSRTSLQIKQRVEEELPHFYNNQKMNHCVANYYRDGHDFIAHHSDKTMDLNLDRQGAIVSVSIGAERILELRRRAEPRDITRLVLPHGSMLILGPVTNTYFTHSILAFPKENIDDNAESKSGETGDGDTGARLSLTLRNVMTFMDAASNRMYGQGVDCKTLQELKRQQQSERISFCLGFGSLITFSMQKYGILPTLRTALSLAFSSSPRTARSPSRTTLVSRSLLQEILQVVGVSTFALFAYNAALRVYHKRRNEKRAREFFTKTSTSGTQYTK